MPTTARTGAARAGVSRVELRPALGVPLMGYGAREGTADARHDPLHVRALYLEGGGRALLVELDLCLIAVAQATELRERISERTGLSPREILVGCIHTHSGPETGLLSVLLGRGTPPEMEPLFDDVVAAAVAAFERAEPARLGVGVAKVAIGRNRRVAGGPVDPQATVLRVDRGDGSPVAVAYVHGCHPTALGHDNLQLSADWPGAAARVIERELEGAVSLFLLGAHADVDPRTRGLLDLAIPDQSVGVSFEEMEALGQEVGDAVADCAKQIETRADVAVRAGSASVCVPVHGSENREAHLASLRAAARDALGLAPDAEPSLADWYRLEGERTAGLPVAELRERLSRVRLLLRDSTAKRVAQGLTAEVEAQVVTIGPMCLLGLPLEVTVDVGEMWRDVAGEFASVVSIANGWMRYLPHERHYRERDAHLQYEILNATFVPEAAEELVAAGRELRSELA